jgi:hypothetical protein
MSGQRRVFDGDGLEVFRSEIRMPHAGGPLIEFKRVGDYRKYPGVPTVAMWMGWRQ